MDLHDSPRVPAVSQFLAKQIGNLRLPLPDLVIRDQVKAQEGVDAQVTFVPSDDVSSAACWCKCGDSLFLFCDGISTAAQGIGTWNGFVGSPLAAIVEPENLYFQSAAGKILSALPLGYLSYTRNIVLAGWSLGGCEAMQVALYGVDRQMWGMPRIATFGSPRFGGTQAARRFEGQNLVRWMCDTDPVPSVPPRVADMPMLPALYGINGTLRLGNFVHAPGGISIDSSGTIVDAETPPLAAPSFPVAISAWLLGADAGSGSPHFIGTYYSRIQAWIDANPNRNSAVRITTAVEPAGQSARFRLSQQQAANERALFVNAQAQEQAAAAVPKPLTFHAYRVGRLWYVGLNGQVISIAPTKRRARGFANAGNDFLRRTLREGYVDTDQLIASLTLWVNAAQDPSSGINPLISTALP
jgi:hypothetical protein